MQKNGISGGWLSEKENHVFLGIGIAAMALVIASAIYNGAIPLYDWLY